MESAAGRLESPAQRGDLLTSSSEASSIFDVGKHIALVPPFRETEVDTYFSAFERIACSLRWPKEVWPLLLQCRLSGKAQEVVAALSMGDALQYDAVKAAVLLAYELVPEAYRQRFRNHIKPSGQTFVEFAREKGGLFDKWCSSLKITEYRSLRELMLLEEFKNCVSERIVVYLNEQKVTTLTEAAVRADEFVLTHKIAFVPIRPDKAPTPRYSPPPPRSSGLNIVSRNIERVCFYCRKPGHIVSECSVLKRKHSQGSQPQKGIGFVKTVSKPVRYGHAVNSKPDPSYGPFIFKGLVSLTGDPKDQQEVRVLRDTGAAQSFLLTDVLPLSDQSSCGSSIIVQGIEMGYVTVPLHRVHLQTELVSGFFTVGIRPTLPIGGVAFIMGNDVAGGKVTPVLEVVDRPDGGRGPDSLSQSFPSVFPTCAVTRAQARRAGETVELADSVLAPMFITDEIPSFKPDVLKVLPTAGKANHKGPDTSLQSKVPVTPEELVAAQRADPTLAKYFNQAVAPEAIKENPVAYFLDNGVLMRKWCPRSQEAVVWGSVYQVVVPTGYRRQILELAHDNKWSGHLGVTKTYNRVLKHFFWAGMKADVVRYCRTCHTCQLAGKPNQVVPRAPLCPIPVIGEPFERVIADCVGPLPRTKSGNEFLLTIMCVATRFPEAVPLRKIKSTAVLKALTRFLYLFGDVTGPFNTSPELTSLPKLTSFSWLPTP